MSYFLVHLPTGWHVDQAILSEEDRVVVIRFGHDHDPTCMQMDEILYSVSERVRNFAVIYVVDITQVPDFNRMYELYDSCSVMFFYVSSRSTVRSAFSSLTMPLTMSLRSEINTSWLMQGRVITTRSTGP